MLSQQFHVLTHEPASRQVSQSFEDPESPHVRPLSALDDC